MKTKTFLSVLLLTALFSCKKDGIKDIAGPVSNMGQIGVTVSSSTTAVNGVSNFNATVSSLENGVSVFTASANVTNQALKTLLSNYPSVFTINGNTVSTSNIRLKQTTEGVKCETDAFPGVVVKYGSKVRDKYPVGNTGVNRTVISKSDTDDYPYGFMLIKTIQVEQPLPNLKFAGITKVVWIANHKFGIVAAEVYLDDNTKLTFPFYWSAEN